ncbi:hypothetical protein FPOAC2_05862 [Fusarium poae]
MESGDKEFYLNPPRTVLQSFPVSPMGFGSFILQGQAPTAFKETAWHLYQKRPIRIKIPSPSVTLLQFMERYPNAHGESGFLQHPFPNIVITDWLTPHGG